MEVDPAVVLELLDDNLVDRGSTGNNVVAVDEEMSRSRLCDVLRLELQGKAIGSLGKRPLCDVDVGAADERPLNSVAFQLDNVVGRLSSGECGLVGVSDAGQSFPSSSRQDDTDYGTSELKSIARSRVDDVRHVYLDELGVGPDVEDMVFFLSSRPELSRREYTWDLFKLCCLYLGNVAPKLPDVSLGSSKVGVTSVDLSSVIGPIQGYLLSGDSEGNFFTDPGSVLCCIELLETFSDRALESDYNPWESVDAHGYENIRAELENLYKTVTVASDVESSSSLSEPVFVSEKLSEQRCRPAQRPHFDIRKTHHSGVAELLAGKLRSKRKTSDVDSS